MGFIYRRLGISKIFLNIFCLWALLLNLLIINPVHAQIRPPIRPSEPFPVNTQVLRQPIPQSTVYPNVTPLPQTAAPTASGAVAAASASSGYATVAAVALGGLLVGGGAAIALSGAGGDSGEEASSSGTTSSNGYLLDGTWAGESVTLTTTGLDSFRNDSEFQIRATTSSPVPYDIYNLEYALASGYNGSGKTIAIFDGKLDTDHPEISGRLVGTYGLDDDIEASANDHHGTHVTVLAAGAKDGNGMMGVASGANIHFTTTTRNPSLASGLIPWAKLATDQAYQQSAIVQNNSWGLVYSGTSDPILVSSVLDYMQDNPSKSAGESLADLLSGDATEYDDYAASLNTMQERGVVVFALENTTNTGAGVLPALPQLYSELKEAWIAVANYDFSYDGNNNIDASRVSNSCGEAASYCLIAIGGTSTNSIKSGGYDNTYVYYSGTSAAAPQVSGAIAVLAQAFPNHSPAELTARLLATANNQYTSYGLTDAEAGTGATADFGNSITHSYYSNIGHGVMNLRAALSPIGTISVATLSSSDPTTARPVLSETSISTGSAMGSALQAAFNSQEMMVFDALNGGFKMAASKLIKEDDEPIVDFSSGWSRLWEKHSDTQMNFDNGQSLKFSIASPDSRDVKSSLKKSRITIRYALDEQSNVEVAWRKHHAEAFNLDKNIMPAARIVTPDSFALSYLREIENGISYSYGFEELDGSSWYFSAITGNSGSEETNEQTEGARNYAFVGRYESKPLPNLRLNIVAGALQEQETVLGGWSSGALSTDDDTSTTFAGIAYDYKLSDKLAFIGSYATGITRPQANENSLFDDFSNIRSDQFSLAIAGDSKFGSDSRWLLSISQPLRIAEGEADMHMPVGRNREGIALFKPINVDLAPSGRQTDIGYAWTTTISDVVELNSAIALHLQPGHDSNRRPEASAAASIRVSF